MLSLSNPFIFISHWQQESTEYGYLIITTLFDGPLCWSSNYKMVNFFMTLGDQYNTVWELNQINDTEYMLDYKHQYDQCEHWAPILDNDGMGLNRINLHENIYVLDNSPRPIFGLFSSDNIGAQRFAFPWIANFCFVCFVIRFEQQFTAMKLMVTSEVPLSQFPMTPSVHDILECMLSQQTYTK